MMAPVVAQDGLEVKASAAGDGRAACVALVAVNLDAVGAQRVEGEGRDGVDGLRDVALPGQRGAHPVADLHRRHLPVDAMHAAVADVGARILAPQAQRQRLAGQPAGGGTRAQIPRFRPRWASPWPTASTGATRPAIR